MALLEIKGLTKTFGGIRAVNNLHLELRQGEILGLIGPNGAGKTTVFNIIAGAYRPTSGRVLFEGEDITRLKPHLVSRKGIARTFQLTNVFRGYTVFENVLVAMELQRKAGFFRYIGNTRLARLEEAGLEQKALQLLQILGIERVSDELAANLPYGYQKALGLCMALALDPTLLLLDEPATGMNADEVALLVDIINKMRHEMGKTILIVEHNMRFIMGICDRIAVLNFGEKICEGLPKDVSENPSVIKAYLGDEEDVA